jgi:hypothetical protein
MYMVSDMDTDIVTTWTQDTGNGHALGHGFILESLLYYLLRYRNNFNFDIVSNPISK